MQDRQDVGDRTELCGRTASTFQDPAIGQLEEEAPEIHHHGRQSWRAHVHSDIGCWMQ